MPRNTLLNPTEFDEPSTAQSSFGKPSDPPEEPILACCFNSNQLQTSEKLFGGLMGAVGIACLGAALFNVIRPEPNVAIAACFGVMGLIVLGLGLVVVGGRLFTPEQGIAVTDAGIELVLKQSSQQFKWNEIHKVLMLEFYPHRAADMVLNVTIEPVKGNPIKFDTNYQGDPGLVIEYLYQRCDYLVRNPQGFTRNTN